MARHPEPVSGTCVTVTLEGRRPLVAEVQALVTNSTQGNPRRTSSGLDAARTAMVMAVLSRRARLPLNNSEVYAATVGGVQLREPGADLALALAIASSGLERPIAQNLVAIGELGLAGEIRSVTGVERRLAEAARLGFTRALVPPFRGRAPDDFEVTEVPHVQAALHALVFEDNRTPR